MIAELHPVLPLALAAVCAPFAGVAGRRALALVAPGLSVLLLALMRPDARIEVQALEHTWVLLQSSDMGRVFAFAFAGYAFAAGLFTWHSENAIFRVSSLGLAAAGVGVTLAGDLLSLFLFWEWLAICSLGLIWQGDGKRARGASLRYILLHVAGGMCLLAGILLHLNAGGSAAIERLPREGWAWWLMLAGIATNAAIPPLHAWLPDAYPASSPEGTVYLSAYTTKGAVYVLACLFAGAELLVWLGAAMALYGVVFAVLENDIRRLLSYHIISQVGYMVCAAGLGTAMALNGLAAHAFCHVFYKGLLMMSAGSVIHATGRGKLSELGGLAGPLRWTLLFCMIGAFSISGVPLFNGFVSKSMVVSSCGEGGWGSVELMLLVASMGTFLHTGLKLPWFVFFGDRSAPDVRRPVPFHMLAAMALVAAVCVGTGVLPGWLYAQLPYPVDYHPYTMDHVVGALQILTATALGFWILRRQLGGEPKVTLDVDRVYCRLSRAAFDGVLWGWETVTRWTDRQSEALGPLACRTVAAFSAWIHRDQLGWHVSAIVACLVALTLYLLR